jgi:hypothetical protein
VQEVQEVQEERKEGREVCAVRWLGEICFMIVFSTREWDVHGYGVGVEWLYQSRDHKHGVAEMALWWDVLWLWL